MSYGPLFTNVLNLAQQATTLLGNPSTAIGTMIAVGGKVVALIEASMPLFNASEVQQLEVTRTELDALIARVNAHADTTIGSLGVGERG